MSIQIWLWGTLGTISIGLIQHELVCITKQLRRIAEVLEKR